MHPHRRIRDMNISQFSVPRCPSVSRYVPVPSSLAWCTMETMATTLCCPSNSYSVKFHNRQQMTKALWSKKKKARVICSCDCQSHSLVLSCFPCFCLCIVCFPLVMGSFEEGERTQSVSQGEGAVIPAPRIRSFPQPQVTWFRDGRKIPPSSRMWVFFSCCFSVFLFVGPFVSYLAFLFDSRNIFWVCFFFPFFFLCPWRCLRALVWEQLFLPVVCFSSC